MPGVWGEPMPTEAPSDRTRMGQGDLSFISRSLLQSERSGQERGHLPAGGGVPGAIVVAAAAAGDASAGEVADPVGELAGTGHVVELRGACLRNVVRALE